jgi:two-component system, chemotaxis family, sensor kinase CheA
MAINKDPILEMYIFETNELIEKLEEIILDSEKNNSYLSNIDEIFRIMHTLKGNSAMMLFDNISALAHSLEDLFDYIRKSKSSKINYSEITDLVLQAKDFIITEITKIQSSIEPDGDAKDLIDEIENKLLSIKEENKDANEQVEEKQNSIKHKFYISSNSKHNDSFNSYKAIIRFSDDCQMENVRAFTVLHKLNEIVKDITYYPEDIIENEESAVIIKSEGFTLFFRSSKSAQDIKKFINETSNIKSIDVSICSESDFTSASETNAFSKEKILAVNNTNHIVSNVLSVNVEKMDMLMDLVGELVVSESMVTGSSDLKGIQLDNFNKSARQHRKIINDLQDVVMAVRMVPIASTFLKMNRIVRDMCKNLSKDVELKLIGEDTEVDKNIIESISDPLMHLIRNSMDHGIEDSEERAAKGKNKKGTITLEAKNEGGDVYIKVKDDGRGLDKTKIYNKAFENGITDKAISELTDKEIYSFILIPGFSTNDTVTEYSGRGVGMDVVCKNIDKIRGTVLIDSVKGKGTSISIKIPLTLAIIDGMLIQVGNASYTIPTISIRRSFKLKEKDFIVDPDGNEMIMVRGECYPLIRLYEVFQEETKVKNLFDGIIIMVENGSESICLFADELIGQQQVVIKTLPLYIKKTKGIAGCTLLGNGNISLILDISSLIS